MSLSPTDDTGNAPDSYLTGWVATQRMVRDGLSWSGYERNCAFLNVGGPRFADVSAVSGLDFDDDARAVAFVDWDFDGKRDLWFANRTGPRVRFMHNVAPEAGSFLTVRLTGRTCNRDAIGARLEVHVAGASGAPYVQTLRADDGYIAQSSKWVHFGLPRGADIDRLVVRWPGGAAEELRGLKLNGFYTLTEGEAQAREWTPSLASSKLVPERLKAPPVPEKARIIVSSRPPMPALEYSDLAGQSKPLTGDGSAPVLVNLWAGWCPNCLTELKGWAADAEKLRSTGLRILALSVDEDEAARGKAREILKDMNWPFEAGFAPLQTVDVLDIVQRVILERDRRIPLPTSFIIDKQGQLTFIYKGPVETATLLTDTQLLGVPATALRQAACPFPGTWVTTPSSPDLVGLSDELGQQGYPQLAGQVLAHGDKSAAADSSARFLGAQMNIGVSLQREGKYEEAAKLFQDLLAQKPGHPDILNNLGNALAALGRYDEAVNAFSESLRIRPDHADTMANMAPSLRALRRHDEAESMLRRALSIYPSHTKALNELAMVLLDLKRPDEALELWRKALELDPGNVPATFNLALVVGRAGRSAEAIELCRRVIHNDPQHAQARSFMGLMLRREGKRDEAAAEFQEALRLAPRDQTTLYNLCLVLIGKGDLTGAEACAQRLGELNPERAAPLLAELEKARAKAAQKQ